MLSIGVMSSGQENYYLNLSQEDYYLKGGEPEGYWHGEGAKGLHLSGKVRASHLRACFRGYSPDGKKLVRNAIKESKTPVAPQQTDQNGVQNAAQAAKKKQKQRDPGWDLTFSVPKSVSTLWSQADESLRMQIQGLIDQAFRKSIGYLESEAAFCRVGRGGSKKVKAKLVVAGFAHGTSRLLDPQYHIHGLVLNAGLCPDGKYRALSSIDLFRHKMAAGAYFRAALAHELQEELGVKIIRPLNKKGKRESWFEIEGVNETLMKAFSKRRTAIKGALGKLGLESAAAAAIATKDTRNKKGTIPPRDELFKIWQEEGRRHGFTFAKAGKLLGRVKRTTPAKRERRYQKALHEAVEFITDSESHFSEQELLRRTLEAAQGWGLEPHFVMESVKRDIQDATKFIRLGEVKRVARYSTKEVLETEKLFIDAVDSLHRSEFKPLDANLVEKIIAAPQCPDKKAANSTSQGKPVLLNQEQSDALRYLTQGEGRIKVLNGFAGTGKTTLLSAMEKAYTKQGYRVIGCSVAGVAAQGMQTGAGIQSDTVAMRLNQITPDTSRIIKHHARQLWRAAQGKRTYAMNRLKIDRKTVLVVDEAGMLGTKQFAHLSRAVAKAGGIMVCVGDHRQLPSINAGGGFEFIAKRVGQADLQEIGRQTDHLQREIVKALERGEAKLALQLFAECGQLKVSENQDKTAERLIEDWRKYGGVEQPKDHVIVVATNREVDRYNDLAQRELAQAGRLKLNHPVKVGEEILYPGDRVIFTQKSRKLGVENGDRGVLVGVKPWGIGTTVTIQLDKNKETVTIPMHRHYGESFQGFQRGYAFTTHKLQGATVDRSYIHVGGKMTTKEMAYVQCSRHRESIHLYTEKLEAGRELAKIARDHAKQELHRQWEQEREQTRHESQQRDTQREKQNEQKRQEALSREKLPEIDREREKEARQKPTSDQQEELRQKHQEAAKAEQDRNREMLQKLEHEHNTEFLEKQRREQHKVQEKSPAVEHQPKREIEQQPKQEQDEALKHKSELSREKPNSYQKRPVAEPWQSPQQSRKEEIDSHVKPELKREPAPSQHTSPAVEPQPHREKGVKVEQEPKQTREQPVRQEAQPAFDQSRENQQRVEQERIRENVRRNEQNRKEELAPSKQTGSKIEQDVSREKQNKVEQEKKQEPLEQSRQSRKKEVDEALAPLVKQMAESRAKQLAHEVLMESQKRQQEQEQARSLSRSP